MPTPRAGRLVGRRVIVTRAAERAGGLSALLRDEGAELVEIAVTRTDDATDGGRAFREAMSRVSQFDWIVVTSPEGARRVSALLAELGVARSSVACRVAAVGRATAELIGGADLVPSTQTSQSLGELFPTGTGRVLLAVAESAGTDFETVARDKGWMVERVHSYRTVAVRPADADRDDAVLLIRSCDAITFTAASSVEAWVEAFGVVVPPVVVAMGPQTARTLQRCGITGVTVAAEQSLAGIVAAIP